jgi:GNAT superfamily N-acetyltransferase
MSEIRRATASDLDDVTETLWLAFGGDPLWSWAFPEHAQLRPLWRLFVGSAIPHEWVWMIDDRAAAAVWIPPGRKELSPQEEALVEPLLRELAGPRAPALLALFERFEHAHPTDPPHYYLSLLGTRPERRGEGLGMRLLSDNLASIDTEHAPAYLESSNPVNEPRYESLGFVRTGSFETPDGSREVTTMWREPAAPA